ncbi:MAG: LytTR family transcriptional regulator [Cyclobacteriaceae bacterium]|nr:LytTR family transcriptional regulator [Cyclobacteriaceae bacterium]
MRVKELLSQDYPLFTFRESIDRDIFFGVFLTLFLLVFTPFGLDDFAYDRYYIILGYGLVTFLSIVVNDTAGYTLFPGIFSERRWKVYHQILWGLWHLFCMGVANLTYGVTVGAFPLNLSSFFKIELYVLLSAVIPIVVFVLLRQNYLLRKNVKVAENLNQQIHQNAVSGTAAKEDLLTLVAENNRDQLKVNAEAILFIASQDNYAEVVTFEGGKLSKQLIRSTLSRIESSLQERPNFFRCHRAFIVNMNKVISVAGNSQGCQLVLSHPVDPIPVSRANTRLLKEKFETAPR